MISRLVFPLIILAIETRASITWDSPAAGDIYIPGDALQAVWISTERVVSPSFTICAVADANDAADCGTAVWPPVNQNGTEYSISLAVPNITGNGDYYLVMKDDQGTTYDTPDFSLASTKMGIANTTASSSVTPTGTSITYVPSHPAPTIAAIAVPLSLVAATLFIALLLLLCRMRRTRQREKEKQETRIPEKFGSQHSDFSFASAADIERAVLALAAMRGYGLGHAYGPPLGANSVAPAGAQGLGAVGLGKGAFGWAHGSGHAAPVAPAIPNTYIPALAQQAIAEPGANPQYQQHVAPAAAVTPSPVSQSQHENTPYDLGTVQAVSQSPASGALRIPEIQVHRSSPPPHVQDSPPPLPPPKQLLPGSSPEHAPRLYDAPDGFTSPQLSRNVSGHPPPPLGPDAHASLNVISSYTQASPALSQDNSHLVPPVPNYIQTLRPLPPGLTRARTLRRLEKVPEGEKQLPATPRDRIGTELYEAVSRAVRG